MNNEFLYHYRNDIVLKERPLDLSVPLYMLELREIDSDLGAILSADSTQTNGEFDTTARRKRTRQTTQVLTVKRSHRSPSSNKSGMSKRARVVSKIESAYEVMAANIEANGKLADTLNNGKMNTLRLRFDLSQRQSDIQRFMSERELQEENYQLGIDQLRETEREVMKHHEVYENRIRKILGKMGLEEKVDINDNNTNKNQNNISNTDNKTSKEIDNVTMKDTASSAMVDDEAVVMNDQLNHNIVTTTETVNNIIEQQQVQSSVEKNSNNQVNMTLKSTTDTTTINNDKITRNNNETEQQTDFTSQEETEKYLLESHRLREWRVQMFQQLQAQASAYVGDTKDASFIIPIEAELASTTMVLANLEDQIMHAYETDSPTLTQQQLQLQLQQQVDVKVDISSTSTITTDSKDSTDSADSSSTSSSNNNTNNDIQTQNNRKDFSEAMKVLIQLTNQHVTQLERLQRDNRLYFEQHNFLLEREEEKQWELDEYKHQIERQKDKCNSKLKSELLSLEEKIKEQKTEIENIMNNRKQIEENHNKLRKIEEIELQRVQMKADHVSLADRMAHKNEDSLFELIGELSTFRGCHRQFNHIGRLMKEKMTSLENDLLESSADQLNDSNVELSELQEKHCELQLQVNNSNDNMNKVLKRNEILMNELKLLKESNEIKKQELNIIKTNMEELHEKQKKLQMSWVDTMEKI